MQYIQATAANQNDLFQSFLPFIYHYSRSWFVTKMLLANLYRRDLSELGVPRNQDTAEARRAMFERHVEHGPLFAEFQGQLLHLAQVGREVDVGAPEFRNLLELKAPFIAELRQRDLASVSTFITYVFSPAFTNPFKAALSTLWPESFCRYAILLTDYQSEHSPADPHYAFNFREQGAQDLPMAMTRSLLVTFIYDGRLEVMDTLFATVRQCRFTTATGSALRPDLQPLYSLGLAVAAQLERHDFVKYFDRLLSINLMATVVACSARYGWHTAVRTLRHQVPASDEPWDCELWAPNSMPVRLSPENKLVAVTYESNAYYGSAT
ncbi:hypothetical protein IWQ60_000597 [Tieghemiomyces parasiticus]|uniref:Uncharacterized protein n=1 Tax=Tieghemiomyces parasiticus TaxID=78921 RepID=A0A9W8AIK9_9FUNG|nr:hypothetical protein IWQ60_000597 [Tieghemiomyces parasiticus]